MSSMYAYIYSLSILNAPMIAAIVMGMSHVHISSYFSDFVDLNFSIT